MKKMKKIYFKIEIICVLWCSEKPRPDGLALAFQQGEPGQSQHEADITARLGLAYSGLAWPGSRLKARPEQHYRW
jgi:hypothetical protein